MHTRKKRQQSLHILHRCRRRKGELLSRLFALVFSLYASVPAAVHAQTAGDELRWSFARQQGAVALDGLRGVKGTIEGKYSYVGGVQGVALRFDGYTTSMTVPAAALPSTITGGFTVEAWVALDTYPWNWVPLLDQQKEHEAGFLFGIDAFGHVALEASLNGQWQSAVSTATVPLKRWAHLAGTLQTAGSRGLLTVYMNGTRIAQLPVDGAFSPAKTDLLVGRVRQPRLPFPEAEVKPPHAVWYALDGLLDEVVLYGHGLSQAEIAGDYAAVNAPQTDVLPWQKMPAGPAQPGRFGAYYATLKYEDTWDRLRQIGPDGDVVVRFDNSSSRLVFWQGLNYVPAWVSGDDKWSTDEFLEVWDAGCPDSGDCEPMSDKQGRFSHVEILESNNVRAVVHWRYALVEAVGYKGAWPEARTGWTDWADEYWTVYPDGIAVRKQVLHSARVSGVHEWQETIVLHQPGKRPEDDINADAITLGNMQGQTKSYTWQARQDGAFADPVGPSDVTPPPNANMQLVNLKSTWKPFQIVPPDGVSSDFYNNEKSYFQFECWNHWPVAQIASSDRPCVTVDRPSHSSLSHLFWKTYTETDDTATKILMSGLTTQSLPELIPLAKSWIDPPRLLVQGGGYTSEGYDPTQRAYVVFASAPVSAATVHLVLKAENATALYHPAVIIRGWGDRNPSISVNGKPVTLDKNVRVAVAPRLDSSDLLIWIGTQSVQSLQIDVRATSK